MATTLTADDARESLSAHVARKGIEVFLQFGPRIDWAALQRLLADRAFVRYPCAVVFESTALLAGEFAQAIALGEHPEAGFAIHVHPSFARDLDRVPALVLYHLVVVNYGAFASAEEAETFGAAALGLTRDEYYARLCAVSDQLGGVSPGEFADSGSTCVEPPCSRHT